jgi:hypothetical protein
VPQTLAPFLHRARSDLGPDAPSAPPRTHESGRIRGTTLPDDARRGVTRRPPWRPLPTVTARTLLAISQAGKPSVWSGRLNSVFPEAPARWAAALRGWPPRAAAETVVATGTDGRLEISDFAEMAGDRYPRVLGVPRAFQEHLAGLRTVLKITYGSPAYESLRRAFILKRCLRGQVSSADAPS